MPIKVLIVDDSATVRAVLCMILENEPEINVIGTAVTADIALRKMAKEWPDVIISDLEMPGMHGLDFLRHIKKVRPTPFVVCSSHVGVGAKETFEALALGAVEVILKPNIGVQGFLEEITQSIIDAVKAAAQSVPSVPPASATPQLSTPENTRTVTGSFSTVRRQCALIVIGSSTGGTTVIEYILRRLPVQCPPVVIVQHMPRHFTGLFAKRLDTLCDITVKEAEDGDVLSLGHAYIAPGGQHTRLCMHGSRYALNVYDDLPVNRHRPSVDVLFHSAADVVAAGAIGIILTGMGDDGAVGLKHMRDTGALTLGQDQLGSVVYGMPRVAMNIGAVQYQLPYEKMPGFILDTVAV